MGLFSPRRPVPQKEPPKGRARRLPVVGQERRRPSVPIDLTVEEPKTTGRATTNKHA